jgi:PAS domain S-box-containing protein
MMHSDNEEYKKSVKNILDQMIEAFAHISIGDFSKRIDISKLPEDEDFAKTLCGLDMMMDDLIEAQNELTEIKKSLEQQVAERTSELATANEQLTREIEERKQIEDELRESEEHYRLLAESAQDFIYIFDRTFTITYVNNAVAKVLALPKESIIGKNIRDLIPLSRLGLSGTDLFKAMEEKVPLPRQMKIRFPAREIWLDSMLVPIRDEKGDIISIWGLSRDITEQKKASDALEEREKFLTDIFSSIQDGIGILDSNLNIIRVNSKMEQWYSHAMPLVGKKCFEAYHSRSEPCHVCPSINAIRTKKAAYEVVPLHGKDGIVMGWLDLYAFPMFDETGEKVTGVIEYVRDVTARRQAEEKLRQSESLFRTLAETAGAGIFIIKNYKFVYVNQFLVTASGYTREELLSMNFWNIVHPDFRKLVQDRYAARMRGEKITAEYEFRYLRKDGTTGWVAHNVGLFEFEGAPAVIGTLYEISERKKIEEALAEDKELLSVTMARDRKSVV